MPRVIMQVDSNPSEVKVLHKGKRAKDMNYIAN